ncbi:MAG: hypothetical protein DRJ06_03995 [Candidatus Aminicenantes bacterium]|nr:MAG: hypothetical protein DRJ06_03995 [Candidatus Aminicenantes bacterium]
MPGRNGTGPLGMGPMTGRAAGYCAGYQSPGYINQIPVRGFGGRGLMRGLKFGRGYGFRAGAYQYASNMTSQQEIDILREQAKIMEVEVQAINKRIGELEAKANTRNA